MCESVREGEERMDSSMTASHHPQEDTERSYRELLGGGDLLARIFTNVSSMERSGRVAIIGYMSGGGDHRYPIESGKSHHWWMR